jgi:hypothetical protein
MYKNTFLYDFNVKCVVTFSTYELFWLISVFLYLAHTLSRLGLYYPKKDLAKPQSQAHHIYFKKRKYKFPGSLLVILIWK